MAKVPEGRDHLETIVDEDGYESDGMFRWGASTSLSSFEEMRAWLEQWNEDWNKSASDRLSEVREYFTGVVQSYVDGPVPREKLDQFHGRSLIYLNLSTGSGIFAVHKDVPKKGFVTDAFDGLKELDQLGNVLDKIPENLDRIVRLSVRVGMLITRTQLRALFARDVLFAKNRRKASAKGGKATAKWSPEIEALARPIFSEVKRGRVSDSAAYQRTAAKLKSEHDISISAKTLKRRLSSTPDNA